ncbi:hypothetical protein PFISCL1PPCAC_757, partial [Pristionchus fissidentatus]
SMPTLPLPYLSLLDRLLLRFLLCSSLHRMGSGRARLSRSERFSHLLLLLLSFLLILHRLPHALDVLHRWILVRSTELTLHGYFFLFSFKWLLHRREHA